MRAIPEDTRRINFELRLQVENFKVAVLTSQLRVMTSQLRVMTSVFILSNTVTRNYFFSKIHFRVTNSILGKSNSTFRVSNSRLGKTKFHFSSYIKDAYAVTKIRHKMI